MTPTDFPRVEAPSTTSDRTTDPSPADVVARLRQIIESFDDDVADTLADGSGERADLWEEVDVPVADLRQAAALITALQARAEKAERERDEWHQVARKFVVRATRAEERIAEMEAALEPFAMEGWADENGWTERGCPNDRICDWFGPSDFRRARAIRTRGEV